MYCHSGNIGIVRNWALKNCNELKECARIRAGI
jgi:hypothetical protein